MEDKMLHLNSENFKEIINKGGHLVDFYAEWCGPCKMLAPVLEEIDNKVSIIKVDVDMHPDLAMEYGIMSVPTIVYIKDGKILKQTTGFQSKEMLEQNIEELLK
jgi:thioredoxin 1